MPDSVLEDAITRPEADPATAASLAGPAPGTPSKDGTPYDPALHEPRQTAEGAWRAKRGAGAAGGEDAQRALDGIRLSLPPEHPDGQGMPGPEDDGAERAGALETRAAAAACVQAAGAALVALLGPEAAPSREEAQQLTRAHEVAFTRWGFSVDSPGLALGLAWAGFLAGKVQQPTVMERMRGLLGRWFGRRKAAAP